MKSDTRTRDEKNSPDYSLLFTRLEREILNGNDPEACRRILTRESMWENLDAEKLLRWAELAQMAGDIETAIKVFTRMNGLHPDFQAGWSEHAELLSILGRKEDFARLLARAKPSLDRAVWQEIVRKAALPKHVNTDGEDIDGASAPFEAYRQGNTALARFLGLFSGREDCFARQWVDKGAEKQGYYPVRRPIEASDIREHLRGNKTYGIYILREDATVKLAVLDADLNQRFRKSRLTSDERDTVYRERLFMIRRIQELSGKIGLKPLIEFSGGKGFHFWFFFEAPVDAGLARGLLEGIRSRISGDLTSFDFEVFPKQSSLSGKGLGNLVKLPLGIHRLTGKRSIFIACRDKRIEAQLDFLSTVVPLPPNRIVPLETSAPAGQIHLHPRVEKWAAEYPELYRLETMCPPLAQVIAVCREGKDLSLREEKVLFQTVGFLPRRKTLLHYLSAFSAEYNVHQVDYKLSRLRGSPLGCARIHSLLNFGGDGCRFEKSHEYAHPLLHISDWTDGGKPPGEKIENLNAAIENLKAAIEQVVRFTRKE